MNQIPQGQMTWKLPGMADSALHLRHHPAEPWRSYKEFSEYLLPDPPDFSEGYATFIALLKAQWELV
jgi:hypothetical protein